MTWRTTAFDAPRIELLVDPQWLLAPLFVRRAVPGGREQDWQRWWSAAVAFRPGGPAPRQQDLVAFSPALTELWQSTSADFDRWCRERQPTAAVPPVEQQRLASFEARCGHPPAPRTLIVLVVPFGRAPPVGGLLLRPESDRLVVDAGVRLTGAPYLELLDPVLADFF